MKFSAAFALILAVAPAAHALEITDDTPARAVTILKDRDAPNRVLVSPTAVSMGECKSEIVKSASSELAEVVLYAICLPADMTQGDVRGEMPIIDLSE